MHQQVEPRCIVYVDADTLTVTPSGALILAMEVEAAENLEKDEWGERRRRADATGIEVKAVGDSAPGYRYSAVEVDRHSKESASVKYQ